jgi:hypothetical protein
LKVRRCVAVAYLGNPFDPGSENGKKPEIGIHCFAAFGDLGRNVFRGPFQTNHDLSVVKRTNLTERVNLEFRAEAFNFLNHPTFQSPGCRRLFRKLRHGRPKVSFPSKPKALVDKLKKTLPAK